MIKFTAGLANGDTLIGLGISEANVEKLKAGMPIRVVGADMHLPGIEIMIFYGETEADMQADMEQFIGPDTKVHIDPRLADVVAVHKKAT